MFFLHQSIAEFEKKLGRKKILCKKKKLRRSKKKEEPLEPYLETIDRPGLHIYKICGSLGRLHGSELLFKDADDVSG